jgi:hypothetical protein
MGLKGMEMNVSKIVAAVLFAAVIASMVVGDFLAVQ